MKKQRVFTNYLFTDTPDGLAGKLLAMGFEWTNGDALAFPANTAKTFDGVWVDAGGKKVGILHPDPFYESQYWDKLAEVLALFKGIKTIARWDWRKNAAKKALAEQARKEALLTQGRFHILRFNWDWKRQHEETVLATNDPVAAYNAYIGLAEVWDQGGWLEEFNAWSKRCECKILHLSGEIGGKIYEENFWRDSILRSYVDSPSSFEEEFFIHPNMRRGPSYHVGHYSYARFQVYNLMKGEQWESCAVTNSGKRNSCLDLPFITEAKKEVINQGGMEYPIQPRMTDGSVIEVPKSKPVGASKYIYTEPYSGQSYAVEPNEIKDAPTEQLLVEAKTLIPQLREHLTLKHGCHVKDPEGFKFYVTLCAMVEKHTGEDLYKPIPVPK